MSSTDAESADAKVKDESDPLTHFIPEKSTDGDDYAHVPVPESLDDSTENIGPAATIPNTRSKQQQCKVCGKTLSSISSYYVHMKLHSDSKPFKCMICEAAFCRKPYLEVHMRTHTGERPFECPECKKRFTQKSSLNTHKRSHTGEKPYNCDICEKRFSVKSYVEAHRWSHFGDKPLRCDLCAIDFTTKGQFMEHARLHDSKRTFDCSLCCRGFNKEAFLIRHQHKVHRIKRSIAPNPDDNCEEGVPDGDLSFQNLRKSPRIRGTSPKRIKLRAVRFADASDGTIVEETDTVRESNTINGQPRTFCNITNSDDGEVDYEDMVPASYVESYLGDK